MKLLQQVARQPLSLHKELIIVDDYSTDGTREFLQTCDLPKLLGGNGANTVKLVLHEKNMGKGAGVRTGLEQATGELVLIQDADLEYDPRDYPVLITPILEGHADAVFGNRFHFGPHRVPRFGRYVLNRIFSIVCNMLTGISIHDVTACYKVFRRELLVQIHLHSDRFSVETEMTVKLAKLGVRIYEVPIVYHGRTYAEGKKISWKDGWMALYDLVKYGSRIEGRSQSQGEALLAIEHCGISVTNHLNCHHERSEGSAFRQHHGTADPSCQNRALVMTIPVVRSFAGWPCGVTMIAILNSH